MSGRALELSGEGENLDRGSKADARMKVIYKVTFPNGKIYIGYDLTDNLWYFGSLAPERVAADFTREQRRDFAVRRETLWESESAALSEVRRMEAELIRAHRANDPTVGYNRLPKYRGE